MNKNALAFVFPGQGAQTVGMLSDLAGEFKEIEQTFKEASEVLSYDLWQVCQAGPEATLNQTAITQPALMAGSYAIWKIVERLKPISPQYLAGHSLGEYTALVCANSLSFQDGIKLVAARGQFMQEAVPLGTGGMAAIVGLEDHIVNAICKKASEGQVLSPANFNTVGQIVIAGHAVAVTRAIQIAKEEGAKLAMLLPVSVPSHCALMKPAAERLLNLLNEVEIGKPCFPILNNVDVEFYDSAEAVRQGLYRQLFSPVRWVETIRKLDDLNIHSYVECGPGKILTGLIKRMERTVNTVSLSSINELKEFLKE